VRKTLYLILAIPGFVVPFSFFVSFLAANGPDPTKFVQQLFGTPISSFFAADVLLASVVFLFFLRQEGARYAMGRRWVYVVALLTVGLSCAWPLFLYARESRIDRRIA
jgi:hypothetical protein